MNPVHKRIRDLYLAGGGVAEVAAAVDRSPETVKRLLVAWEIYRSKPNREWTGDEMKVVRDNIGSGYREVAKMLPHRTTYAVRECMARVRREAAGQQRPPAVTVRSGVRAVRNRRGVSLPYLSTLADDDGHFEGRAS